MKWSEVRRSHPEAWLVIEALQSHREEGLFVVDEVAVIETCDDGADAFETYRRLHRQHPQRELLFIHTSHEELKIQERSWAGVRADR